MKAFPALTIPRPLPEFSLIFSDVCKPEGRHRLEVEEEIDLGIPSP